MSHLLTALMTAGIAEVQLSADSLEFVVARYSARGSQPGWQRGRIIAGSACA
jgi:hypothetical protein